MRRALAGFAFAGGVLALSATGADTIAPITSNGCPDVTVEASVLHLPRSGAARLRISAASEGIVAASGMAPREADRLAEFYLAVAGHEREAPLPASRPVTVLAVGPLLDAPDRAAVRDIACDDGDIRFEVDHTQVRAQGVNLRRNIQWRPLLEVRLRLAAGAYRVRVTWRPVESVAGGKPLGLPPTRRELVLRIL